MGARADPALRPLRVASPVSERTRTPPRAPRPPSREHPRLPEPIERGRPESAEIPSSELERLKHVENLFDMAFDLHFAPDFGDLALGVD